ncbi:hypothetical protein [Micromonospora sp. NPDC048063]|uniref:hypothetical protein n=1 Tax=Micromonospora sp. NPDC048063 TaxID=3364256 RepID=UPI0037142654
MSRYDVETLVRDTFLSHEAEADEGGGDLTGAVRARVARRRRRARAAGAGAAAVAVLVTAGVVPALTGERPARPSAVDTAAEDRAATADWRWESSLGAEIRVPAHWAVNDSGCGMTDAPSVVRGKTVERACWSPEPADKEIAVLDQWPMEPSQPGGAGFVQRAVDVGGVLAVRAEGRLPDGRFAGTVTVSGRQVAVTVRTRDEATTRRILDSFRLVETDHAGCPTRLVPVAPAPLPGQKSPGPPTAQTTEDQKQMPFVPGDPSSISVCSYGSLDSYRERRDRIEASARLSGAEATALAAALNAARPGGNPAPPGLACAPPDPLGYEALLLVRHQGEEVWVRVNWNGCTRGLDNGASRAQLTMSLLRNIMGPMKTGYSLSHDLPD